MTEVNKMNLIHLVLLIIIVISSVYGSTLLKKNELQESHTDVQRVRSHDVIGLSRVKRTDISEAGPIQDTADGIQHGETSRIKRSVQASENIGEPSDNPTFPLTNLKGQIVLSRVKRRN